MKRYIFAILLLGLTGCMSGTPEGGFDGASVECSGDCSSVNFSMPNDNDLKLETDHHIIHIMADPNSQYAYHVWTGDKTYEDDPDIIVEQGTAYVITNETTNE